MKNEDLVNKLIDAFHSEVDSETKENIRYGIDKCIPIIEDYAQGIVKNIALPSVICSRPTRREKNNLPEDVRYAFCEGVEIYQSIQHYEEGITDHSEFIEEVRAIKQKYK